MRLTNTICRLGLLLAGGLGALALLGRAIGVGVLVAINAGGIPMRVSTSICFLLLAGAIAWQQSNSSARRKMIVSAVAGGVVSLIGLLSLASYLIEFHTGTEWLVGHYPMLQWFLDQNVTRMAFITAILFSLFGGIVALLGRQSRLAANVGHILLLPVSMGTYLVLAGYILGVKSFYEPMGMGVALNTGIAFAALCLAAFCVRPDTWLMSVFTSREAGGTIARRLVPAILLLPVVIGYFRIEGERHYLFPSDVGVALVAVTYTVVFMLLVWLSARSVNRTDQARRQVDDALRENEQRYRSFVEASSQIVWRTNPVGQVDMPIPAWEAYVGQTTQEAFGFGWMDAIDPADRERVSQAWRDAYDSRRLYEVEYRLKRHDGQWRDILARGVPIIGPDGQIREWIGTCIDITERKQAEQAIRRAKDEWERTFHSVPDLIAILDNKHRVVRVNKAMADRLGLTPEECVGVECFRAVHGLVCPPGFCPHALTIRDGKEHTVEVHEPRMGGDFLVSTTPLTDAGGQMIGSVHVARDITQRKQAEQAVQKSLRRFELLSATAAELLQAHQPQQVVESLCRKVMQHLDCQFFFNFMADEQPGKLRLNACAGIPQEEAAKIEWLDYGTAVCGCAARDACRIVAEHIPTTPDPRTELVKSYGVNAYACHPLLGPGGKVLGTLSFGTCTRETFSEDDLSLMKAVADQVAVAMVRMNDEQALRRTAEDLARSNRDLEQFAYVSSHDLQEPLRMVTGFMQLLKLNYGSKLDATADKYINFAVDGAKRMQQLIEDLLSYSRVGTKGREPLPTELGQVVKHAVTNLSVSIKETRALVTVGKMPTVLADGPQLVQVFQNLIGNAIKFRDDKPPVVEVSACQDGAQWVISVKDNGIGFPAEFADKVFMIFQRLHAKEKYPGTGIGLAVCKKIIDRHHGRIWAESTPGHGSTFYFTLPDKDKI